VQTTEQVAAGEREAWLIRLHAFLEEMSLQKPVDPGKSGKICGACLILGGWQAWAAVPAISRFLNSGDSMLSSVAIDSLYLITGRWPSPGHGRDGHAATDGRIQP